MPRLLALIGALALLLLPLGAFAEDARVTLDEAAKALGASAVKSILALAVDDLLPLHGRLVPLAELYRTIGRVP